MILLDEILHRVFQELFDVVHDDQSIALLNDNWNLFESIVVLNTFLNIQFLSHILPYFQNIDEEKTTTVHVNEYLACLSSIIEVGADNEPMK